jgi:transposase
MRRFDFTEEQKRTFTKERYNHPDPQVQRRMEILWLKSQGERHERIAQLAGVSRRTVQRVLDLFAAGGLDAVRRLGYRGRANGLDPYRTLLETEFRERPPRTIAEACARIKQLTGVDRRPSPVRKFLRDVLGLRWRKVAAVPVPPKQTVEEHARTQAKFLENQLEPRLAEARAGQRTVFFVDAAHFVLGSFLGWLWCAARLFVRGASGRQRYNVLGALNAVSHELIRVTNHTYVTAETVCELLRKIAATGLPTPITLVLDNARYQHCELVQNLAEQLGIELLFLPSYSPNLNLIERLWKFVKKKALRSRHHTNYADFHLAIDQCLDRLTTTYRDEIRSLITHKFQTFVNVPLLAA